MLCCFLMGRVLLVPVISALVWIWLLPCLLWDDHILPSWCTSTGDIPAKALDGRQDVIYKILPGLVHVRDKRENICSGTVAYTHGQKYADFQGTGSREDCGRFGCD